MCTAVSLLEFFQHWRWRPLRAGMFAALGLWGVVPVLHGWRLHADVPQVLQSLTAFCSHQKVHVQAWTNLPHGNQACIVGFMV